MIYRSIALTIFGLLFAVYPTPVPPQSNGVHIRKPEINPEMSLLGSWDYTPLYVLDGKARNAPGLQDLLQPVEPAPFSAAPSETVLLFGESPTDRKTNLLTREQLPVKEFSVETWILAHVNHPVGAVIGTLRIFGPEKKGWLLAYYDHQILFGITTKDSQSPGLTTLRVNDSERWHQRWYHIVGTYDGNTTTLYVNGIEKARSAEISGDLLYPDQAALEANAYLGNEPYMQLGELVRNVKLYDRALTQNEVRIQFQAQRDMAFAGKLYPNRLHFTAGPYLQYVTQNSISILWETDQPTAATVMYGKQHPFTETIEIKQSKTLHEITLNNLQGNSPYFYRILALSETGETIDSGNLTFQTAVPEDQPYSFVILGDTEARPQISDRLLKMAWGERPHFLMVVGDLTDGGKRPNRFEWIYEYFASMTQFASRVPVFPVPGNGESDLYWYKHYHSLPEPENYYRFRYGNAEFFMLDSNRDLSPGTEQYEWLQSALAQSTAEWKFAAHHHPAYTSDEDDYGDTWIGPSDLGDLNVRNLVPLYEQYGVDAVFFGHLHTYERTWPIRDGRVDRERGVVYIQTGGAGGNTEDAAPARSWFTSKFYRGFHYCIAQIGGGQFRFRMYDIEGRLKDTFEMNK